MLGELERSRHAVRRLEEEKALERDRCAQAISELQSQLRVSKDTNQRQVRGRGGGGEKGEGGGDRKRCVNCTYDSISE